MADAVVVGGGVGGLAASIRLRAAGHAVVLLERNADVGGKLSTLHRDGFTFDTGPSLVTLPHLIDEVLRCAGTSLDDELEMVRLDPQFAYHWPDGRDLVVRDDGCDAPGYREFVERGRRIWEISERTFLAGPMGAPWDLLRRMRSPRDLVAIDPMRTLHRAAQRTFDHDPHLVQWAGRYATYSGSSPFRAPATLSCIAHVEHRYGCWYPMGGLGALRDALVRAAQRCGVDVRCGVEVEAVEQHGRRATGVRTSDGAVRADVVIANVDAQHLYRDLLPRRRALRRVRRAEPSTSGFVVLVGARGTTAGIAHHNIWFSSDERREFDEIAAGTVPSEPTVYACVSSVTDASQAPPGCENWFLLVNTPPGAVVDRAALADRVLDRVEQHGIALRDRAVFVDTIAPADLARRYRAPGGAIYGTSSNGARAAFVRPRNRGAIDGLYLVGGSSHPGGGLPLVLTSARIVADMVAEDRVPA